MPLTAFVVVAVEEEVGFVGWFVSLGLLLLLLLGWSTLLLTVAELSVFGAELELDLE